MAKIRLIAAFSDKMPGGRDYTKAPFYITPVFNENTKTFDTGQTWSTDPDTAKKQKENCPLVITENDSYQLKHLMIFNEDVEVDRILLNLIKLNPAIAKNKAGIVADKHRFYLEDREEEAVEEISKADIEFEAQTIVRSMSMDDMIEFGMLNGLRVKDLTHKQIQAALLKLVKASPKKMISDWNDKDRKAKIFLKKLVSKDILKLNNGKYIFNEEVIGINESYALEYIKDKGNNQVVTQWARSIKDQSVDVNADAQV